MGLQQKNHATSKSLTAASHLRCEARQRPPKNLSAVLAGDATSQAGTSACCPDTSTIWKVSKPERVSSLTKRAWIEKPSAESAMSPSGTHPDMSAAVAIPQCRHVSCFPYKENAKLERRLCHCRRVWAASCGGQVFQPAPFHAPAFEEHEHPARGREARNVDRKPLPPTYSRTQ